MTDAMGHLRASEEAGLEALQAQVIAAAQAGRAVRIVGGGTKSFYGEARETDEILTTRAYTGIVDYLPSELVITLRAGTRLSEVEHTLAARGQMLGFEPPRFGPETTIGGVVAAGLSGPARPYRGSCRDFVLGMEIINGRGELLRFGGQVMKNVAGYDVSRLQCGALGTLGVIAEVSLRVTPVPSQDMTLCWKLDAEAACARMTALAGKPWPISAMCFSEDCLRVRLSGSQAAIDDAVARLAPDSTENAEAFWQALRDLELPALAPVKGQALWRVSLPPAAELSTHGVAPVIDWGGAQRWLLGDDALGAALRNEVRALGGHVTCMKGETQLPVFNPQAEGLNALSSRVKQAFDPDNIFNRPRPGG